jgi:hypothetical protein
MKLGHRVLVLAAALTGVSGAHLASSPRAVAVGGPGFGCSTHADSLVKAGSTITAEGSQSCDGISSGFTWRKLVVSVRRSRFFGWETMAASNSGWTTPSFYKVVSATHNCAGTGTHTFRGFAEGQLFAPPSIFDVWEYYEARWSC